LCALIDRHLGSYLAEGSIAALQYANLIAVVPVSICGLTLGTAIFPFLSTAIQDRDTQRTREILDKAVRWSLIAAVPVTIWLLFFSQELTGLLYERGLFNQESRLLTASTLTMYALGLVPNVLMAILAKVYYSLRRWGPVMLASVLSVGVKAVLSYWWVVPHGTVGLAAASTVGAMVGVITLAVALPSPFLSGHWRHWLRALLILGVICGIGDTVGRGVSLFLSASEFAVQAVFRLGLSVIVSLVLAVVIGPRLGLSEMAAVWKWIRRSPV
jgi:putative peptidoglycan lipid II flippase